MINNRLISFESTYEGAGKTTQAKLLKMGLESKGMTAHYIKSPDGPFRDLILNNNLDAKTHLLVQLANFSQSVETFKPFLEAGHWVILDRWIDSTYAYQGYGSGMDIGELNKLIDFSIGPYRPARTILLDIPEEESRERLLIRGENTRIAERNGSEYQYKVRTGYLAIAETFSHRIRTINGQGTTSDVFKSVQLAIQDLYGK